MMFSWELLQWLSGAPGLSEVAESGLFELVFAIDLRLVLFLREDFGDGLLVLLSELELACLVVVGLEEAALLEVLAIFSTFFTVAFQKLLWEPELLAFSHDLLLICGRNRTLLRQLVEDSVVGAPLLQDVALRAVDRRGQTTGVLRAQAAAPSK